MLNLYHFLSIFVSAYYHLQIIKLKLTSIFAFDELKEFNMPKRTVDKNN